MMNLPMVQAPIHKRPLLLYLATNLYAIGALIAQENEGGVEQPMYYINRALKDTETRYLRAKKACLAIDNAWMISGLKLSSTLPKVATKS